jgi:transcriptional regulator with XRE-family HTH domain
MTALAMEETALHTSAVGPMSWTGSAVRAGVVVFLVTGTISEPATASTYRSYIPFERTGAGPAGQVDLASAQTTAEAVLEIRRLSGLTWEELGDLFDVSRRSVHHWANGKTVSAKHEQMIRQTLVAIRHLDCGSATKTRALILTPDTLGVSVFELLKAGYYRDAMSRVQPRAVPERRHMPLSEAVQDARRPPAPALLLGADQERPEIPAKARVARAARAQKAG